MKLIVLLALFATTAMAQQATTPPPQPAPATVAPLEGLELKGYERAMTEVKKEKEKAEADKKKAEEEAEANRRAALVMYSAVDKAVQELMEAQKRPFVKEAKRLLVRKQQLTDEMQKVDRRLQELGQQIVAMEKTKNTN